jgi:hypothetical protein
MSLRAALSRHGGRLAGTRRLTPCWAGLSEVRRGLTNVGAANARNGVPNSPAAMASTRLQSDLSASLIVQEF